MKIHVLRREQMVEQPLKTVFEFFSNAANLEQITPPWLRFEIRTPSPISMAAGTLIEYRVRWRFIKLRWMSQIVEWDPPQRFVDVQIHGPYSLWNHTHEFIANGKATRIVDTVRYQLPWGLLGAAAHRLTVARDLAAIFDYRAKRTRELFARKE